MGRACGQEGLPGPRQETDRSEVQRSAAGTAAALAGAVSQVKLCARLGSRGLCSHSANTVGNFNRQCLSCDLVENCTYFSASFSHSSDFFLLKCEGECGPVPRLGLPSVPGTAAGRGGGVAG